jgi:hypothetical protein
MMRRVARQNLRIGVVFRYLPFIGAAAGIYFFWMQIAGYGASLVANRAWVEHVEVVTLSELNAAVFKRLVDNDIIWAERRPGIVLLRHTHCTSATTAAPETAAMRATLTKDQRHQLIDLLCRSPQGAFIQNEIESWNLSYELLSVRDNRNVNVSVSSAAAPRPPAGAKRTGKALPVVQTVARRCTNSAVVTRFFVPSGCYENAWEAAYIRGNIRAPLQTNPIAEPPLYDYAFLAAEGVTYPGDWRTFTPFAGDRVRGEAGAPVGQYELTTDITVGSEPVAVHAVGYLFDLRIGSRDWQNKPVAAGRLPARLMPQKLRVDGLTVEIDLLCPSAIENNDPKICLSRVASDETTAYQITITGQRSTTVRLGLQALPSLVPAGELADAKDAQAVTFSRANNIEATCNGPHPKRAVPADGQVPAPGICSLAWLEAHSAEKRGEANEQVFLRTGDKSLVEPSGILTDASFEDGLAEIIGLGPTTYGSLAQGLARARNLKEPVRLTIDADIQRMTRDVLSDNIRCNPRNRRANPATCEDATRGTVVVMDADAGKTGGEILGVASWPRMDRGLGAWDLSALDAGMPSESPIAGNGWRAHDLSSMAGSTFKIITSLAAIQRVLETGDENLSGILMGTAPVPDLQNRLRLRRATEWEKVSGKTGSGSCVPVQAAAGAADVVVVYNAQGKVVRCIGNARGENGAPGLYEGNMDAYRRACGGVPAGRYGVCEALAMSSNLYFSGLALYLDAPRLDHQEPVQALPDIALAQMARRLMPDDRGQGMPPGTRRRDYPLVRGLPFSPSRLGATPFILPAEAARVFPNTGPRQLDLALNGIGQAVTATPVDLATAYASLGSQTIIRPTLVLLDQPRDQRGDKLEGQPLLNVPPDRRSGYEKLMEQVKHGLNGVMTVGTGACGRRCPFQWSSLPQQLRNGIFVKTGTATLSDEGERSVFSAWMAGWVEPPVGIRSGITHRTVIVCHVSRTTDFGATACGAIVGELIRRLHSRGQ